MPDSRPVILLGEAGRNVVLAGWPEVLERQHDDARERGRRGCPVRPSGQGECGDDRDGDRRRQRAPGPPPPLQPAGRREPGVSGRAHRRRRNRLRRDRGGRRLFQLRDHRRDGGDELVSAAGQGHDEAMVVGRFAQHLAQRRDVARQVAFFHRHVAPHLLEERVLADRTPGMPDERLEDVEHARRDGDGLSVAVEPAIRRIQHERAEGDTRGLARGCGGVHGSVTTRRRARHGERGIGIARDPTFSGGSSGLFRTGWPSLGRRGPVGPREASHETTDDRDGVRGNRSCRRSRRPGGATMVTFCGSSWTWPRISRNSCPHRSTRGTRSRFAAHGS